MVMGHVVSHLFFGRPAITPSPSEDPLYSRSPPEATTKLPIVILHDTFITGIVIMLMVVDTRGPAS